MTLLVGYFSLIAMLSTLYFTLSSLFSVAARVVSQPRTLKKVVLSLKLVTEDQSGCHTVGYNQTCVEVSNVPETVSEEMLKAYFEGARLGSCADAVAECTKIHRGIFHVTFHDSKGN